MGARFLQLDVFCHRPGGGNPLGVVIGADHWPDPALQAFATWTNLVETTYLLAPTMPAASSRACSSVIPVSGSTKTLRTARDRPSSSATPRGQ